MVKPYSALGKTSLQRRFKVTIRGRWSHCDSAVSVEGKKGSVMIITEELSRAEVRQERIVPGDYGEDEKRRARLGGRT